MVSLYFLKLKIPVMVIKADTNLGSCHLMEGVCTASERKKLSGRYGLHEKMLECFGNVKS